MPLGTLRELQRGHLDHTVVLGGIGNVNAFVDGEASDLAQVVVRMGPYGADSIRAEGYALWGTPIDFLKFCFAKHQ